MAIKHVETSSGFAWDIDDVVLDDAEILDFLADIEEGNMVSFVPLLRKVLTPQGKKALYDHLRTEDGRVPYAELDRETTEIFKALHAKN